MAENRVVVSTRKRVRVITLHSPATRNALNLQAYKDVIEALHQADVDSEISCVAITGSGNFYSSGFDITEAANSSESLDEVKAKSKLLLGQFIRAFYTFSKLLIAVVNGPCIGIGATSAALCDIIYAVDTAYFQTPFTRMGLCAEGCSSYTFPRILGQSKAAEMLLLNHKMSASEALQFGFVAQVFKSDEMLTKLWPKIEEYGSLPTGSVKATKSLTKRFEMATLEMVNKAELEELGNRWISDEYFNGVMDFLQRKHKL